MQFFKTFNFIIVIFETFCPQMLIEHSSYSNIYHLSTFSPLRLQCRLFRSYTFFGRFQDFVCKWNRSKFSHYQFGRFLPVLKNYEMMCNLKNTSPFKIISIVVVEDLRAFWPISNNTVVIVYKPLQIKAMKKL